jgi:hypothetical protein
MKHVQAARGDSPRLAFTPARIAASLSALDRADRVRARAAADALIVCLHKFIDAGQVPLSATVGQSAPPQSWQHYQPAEAMAIDGRPGALHYYYHAHPTPGAHSAEHGHFHLFAQLGADEEGVARYTHLIAIGVDARGLPIRLFTTNRWVTDETWLPADRLITLAEQIADSRARRSDPVDGWLRAQLGVFAPQIAGLLHHRDRRIAARLKEGRRPGLFEDRRMHVVSQCLVSVERQLTALDHVIH